MRPSVRRLGAVVAAATLLTSGATLLAGPANAVTDPRPVTIGADWLAGQLVSGLQQSSFGGPDVGLSIDSATALASVGGHASDISAISDAVGPQLVKTGEFSYGYAESDEYSYSPTDPNAPGVFQQKGYYASGLAKSLYFAESTGISNIPAWAGTDLVADLGSLVATSGPSTGRLEDNSYYGDFANVLSQAYGASGLIRAGSPKQTAVLDYLLEQQCTAGYFRLNFTPDKNADDQTCDGGRAAKQSAPDPDVTAEVTRLLIPFANSDITLARRVGRAEGWLASQQRADGSFVGGTSTAVPNANSTGLAGWTLMLLGDDAAAKRAAGWIRQHQADEVTGCADGLTTETGAIGYDDPTVGTAITSGIGTARPKWVRSTSQALPVLQVLSQTAPALVVGGSSGYVQASRAAAYKVTGAVPGEKLCLTGGAVPVRVAANADGVATGSVMLPAGTATRTITVTDRDGATDGTTTKVLGSKTLAVKASKAKVKRGKAVTVTVSGLAAGEKVTVFYRGKAVRTGTATAAGTFVRSIPVGRKLGFAAITAAGQFPAIRKGATRIKVVR